MATRSTPLRFPRRIAKQLVIQTLKGSVAFYETSPSHLARLRNQVTLPAGTTAAALYLLEKAGFRPATSRAVWAAYERSIQRGRGQKRAPVGPEKRLQLVNGFTKRSPSVIIPTFIPEPREGSGARSPRRQVCPAAAGVRPHSPIPVLEAR